MIVCSFLLSLKWIEQRLRILIHWAVEYCITDRNLIVLIINYIYYHQFHYYHFLKVNFTIEFYPIILHCSLFCTVEYLVVTNQMILNVFLSGQWCGKTWIWLDDSDVHIDECLIFSLFFLLKILDSSGNNRSKAAALWTGKQDGLDDYSPSNIFWSVFFTDMHLSCLRDEERSLFVSRYIDASLAVKTLKLSSSESIAPHRL